MADNPFDDLVPQGGQQTAANADPFGDLVPQQPQTPGFLSTLGQAGARGVQEGLRENAEGFGVAGRAVSGQGAFQYHGPEAKPDDYVSRVLQQPFSEGWSDPNWWAAQIAHGTGKTSPSLAMGLAGGAAGTAAAGPGAGTLVGGAAGFGVGSVMQTIAPAYQRAREEGLDHDAAVDRALKSSAVAGAFGTVMGLAPGAAVTGKTVEGALKRPIGEALAQIFGVQPAIGAVQQVTQQAGIEGKPVTADDLATGYATNVGSGLALTAGHRAMDALRPAARAPAPVAERVEPSLPWPETATVAQEASVAAQNREIASPQPSQTETVAQPKGRKARVEGQDRPGDQGAASVTANVVTAPIQPTLPVNPRYLQTVERMNDRRRERGELPQVEELPIQPRTPEQEAADVLKSATSSMDPRAASRALAWARDNNRPDIADALVQKAGDYALHLKDLHAEHNTQPTAKQAPVDMLGYIRNAGGIRDPNGELKAMQAHERPGIINNKSGMNPDDMRSLLVQKGYLQDSPHEQGTRSSLSDLYSAIDDGLRGRKIYRPDDEAAAQQVNWNRTKSAVDEQEAHAIRSSIRDWHDTYDLPYAFRDAEEAEIISRVKSGMSVEDAVERSAIDWYNEVHDGAETVGGRSRSGGAGVGEGREGGKGLEAQGRAVEAGASGKDAGAAGARGQDALGADDLPMWAAGGGDGLGSLIADTKRRHAHAEAMVRDAFAQPNPRLMAEGKNGLKTVLTKAPDHDGFRVTTFRDGEPVGHREYRGGVDDLKQIVADMVQGGLRPPERPAIGDGPMFARESLMDRAYKVLDPDADLKAGYTVGKDYKDGHSKWSGVLDDIPVDPKEQARIARNKPLYAAVGAQQAVAKFQLARGATYTVADNIMPMVHDAVVPLMHILPRGAKFGALARLEPLKQSELVKTPIGEIADTRAVFVTPSGEEFSFVGPRTNILSSGALFDPKTNGIGLISFDTIGHLDQGVGGRGEMGIGDSFARGRQGAFIHEVVHLLKRAGAFPEPVWNRLVTQANALGILDSDLRTHLQAIGDPKYKIAAPGVTLRELYNEWYAGRRNVPELLDEEAVTHMMQQYHHGHLGPMEVAPVKAHIEDLLDGKYSRAPVRQYKGWVNKPDEAGQVAAIERNRGPPTDLDPMGYYSGALRAARALRQAKGTPEQMLAMLSKEGAKKAEIEATGLDKFLAGKSSVTRDEIVQFLDKNRVGLKEVTKKRGDNGAKVDAYVQKRMADWREREEGVAKFDETRDESFWDSDKGLSQAEKFMAKEGVVFDGDVLFDDPIGAFEKAGVKVTVGEVPVWEENNGKWFIIEAPSGRALLTSEFDANPGVYASKEKAIAGLEDMAGEQVRAGIREAEHDVMADFRSDAQRMFEVEDDTKFSSCSLDPSNPTYRETVLHLSPEDIARSGYDFVDQHFPEQKGTTGDTMSSLVKHDGKLTYLLDQIQSTGGQKLRDGGVRDKAKIADLERRNAEINARWVNDPGNKKVDADATKLVQEAYPLGHNGGSKFPNQWEGVLQLARDANKPAELRERASELRLIRKSINDLYEPEAMRLRAELRTAEASTLGHPLVNTTDQWTTTTLRRALRQAVEAGADFIAIPHGDTVLSYNPGDTHGMRGFYGSRTSEGIVPKNLRKILERIDHDSAKPVKVEELETPNGLKGWNTANDKAINPSAYRFDENQTGFTLFPLTDVVKAVVLGEGQPLFAAGPMFQAGVLESEKVNRPSQQAGPNGDFSNGSAGKPASLNQQGITAYHASPHDFDKFSSGAAGFLPGDHRYGAGHYFDSAEEGANYYRNRDSTPGRGHMYKVEINADPADFADLRAPLADQPKRVRDALRGVGGDKMDALPLGQAMRQDARLGVSDKLKAAGVPGVVYDNAGRNGYVVFDDKLITILKKYGIVGTAAAGGMMYGAKDASAIEDIMRDGDAKKKDSIIARALRLVKGG